MTYDEESWGPQLYPHLMPSKPRPRWSSLLGGMVALALMVLGARAALRLASWAEPAKYASIAVLLVSLGLGALGIRALWRWARALDWRRVLAAAAIAYVVSVLVVGLVTPSPGGVLRGWLDAAVAAPLFVGRQAARAALDVARYPDDFHATYTGRSRRTRVPGADGRAQPLVINVPGGGGLAPAPERGAPAAQVRQGQQRTITALGAELCRMDALAEGALAQGDVVRVLEGPQFRGSAAWWRVQGAAGSGWCPAGVLE